MKSERYTHTGRRWRCRDEALIDEFRENKTGETRYYLTLDKPWYPYHTLRGAKTAARHRGVFGEWVEARS